MWGLKVAEHVAEVQKTSLGLSLSGYSGRDSGEGQEEVVTLKTEPRSFLLHQLLQQ